MAPVDDGFVPCFIKELPPRLREQAAKLAAEINPRNAPVVPPPPGVEEPARLLVLNNKWWGSAPRTLTVSFMEDYPLALKQRILSHMNAWNCGITFMLLQPGQVGNVRITLRSTGYWSYLGTDILHVPANMPTMCLQNFDTQQRESEWNRVIRHETGHTLGFPHEHLRREIVQRVDPEKAYAYYGAPPNNWDRATTYNNVLNAMDPSTVTGTQTDELSIMCYWLPGQIMRDGRPVTGGSDINAWDFNYCHTLYPKPRGAPLGKGGVCNGVHGEAADDWGAENDVDVEEIRRQFAVPSSA